MRLTSKRSDRVGLLAWCRRSSVRRVYIGLPGPICARQRGSAASAASAALVDDAADDAVSLELGSFHQLGVVRAGATTASGSNVRGMSGIGVLREGPLHAAIKAYLANPGDRFEVPVDRFVVDLVRDDGELVEIQTGGFAALGPKLDVLLDHHRVRIVHPVAAERRIVRVDQHGELISTRRSPRRATVVAVFDKLVSFPCLLTHPNLTVEVLLLCEDHILGPRPVAGTRVRDLGQRRLVQVLERIELNGATDIVNALPAFPDGPFSTRELAVRLGCSVSLAQRTAYCLRAIGIIGTAGKRGRTPLHQLSARAPTPS